MNRALIVRKKWLDKILDQREDEKKIWEMRSSMTHIRGLIGLIESGSGLVIGSAELTDSFEVPQGDWCYPFHKVEDLSLLEKWPYAWVLSNAKRFDEPIPYKHPKGAVIWVKI